MKCDVRSFEERLIFFRQVPPPENVNIWAGGSHMHAMTNNAFFTIDWDKVGTHVLFCVPVPWHSPLSHYSVDVSAFLMSFSLFSSILAGVEARSTFWRPITTGPWCSGCKHSRWDPQISIFIFFLSRPFTKGELSVSWLVCICVSVFVCGCRTILLKF